jgi:translation initiation factor 3 subunit L
MRGEWERDNCRNMSQPRASLWAAEDIDEDLQVDVHLAIGNYGQNGLYDDGPYIHSVITPLLYPQAHHSPCTAAQPPRIDEATLVAVQHQMAQQAAFAQTPDPVKRVRPV